MAKSDNSTLYVLWTSADRDVAERMVFMYTLNSRLKGWWENVNLLIWGPSAKLITEDAGLQKKLQEMKNAGVNLLACKACADMYGLSDKLEALGVTVKYTGELLTNILKNDDKLISI